MPYPLKVNQPMIGKNNHKIFHIPFALLKGYLKAVLKFNSVIV